MGSVVTPADDAPKLLSGPARYVANTPWRPLPAIAVTILIFAGQIVGVLAAIALINVGPDWLRTSLALGDSMSSPGTLLIMIISQIASIALVWAFAGYKGARAETLQLTRPARRWATYLKGGLLTIAATGLVELVFYKGLGYDLMSDAGTLAEGMHSPYWPAAVFMAVVLAPLWEELTFRGFLLSALAQSPLGFWGAALVTNTAWTILHWSYSLAGLVTVFTAGMMLTWLIWRTGSIRVPIAAHAISNLFASGFAYWLGGGMG